MKKLHSIDDVAQKFISHYSENKFDYLPHSSLLDPLLSMTFVGSAGLSQIESEIQKGIDHSGKKAFIIQPCFRHFDIDKVGKTPFHLSFFEMGAVFDFDGNLTNSIVSVFNLLVDKLSINPDRLWITCFGGGDFLGMHFEEDLESYNTWRNLELPVHKILKLPAEQAFWLQGAGLNTNNSLRKCGLMSEVFFELDNDCQKCVECTPISCTCGRFIEIANILNIDKQWDSNSGKFHMLVTPFVETVIGLERVGAAIHNHHSVHDISHIRELIRYIRHHARPMPLIRESLILSSEKVIADHMRSLIFLVSDGAPPPGKGGRQRIIKLLIRGLLSSQRIMNLEDDFLKKNLIDYIIDLESHKHSHLRGHFNTVAEYIDLEQTRFEKTILKGIARLENFLTYKPYLLQDEVLELNKQFGLPMSLIEAESDKRGFHFL